MNIPFCPIPAERAKKIVGSTFYSIAEPLTKISPSLELEMDQAGFEMSSRDYLSIAIFSSLFMFIVMYVIFTVIASFYIPIIQVLFSSLLVGLLFFGITFFYIRAYPKLIIRKRTYDIERNMLYALRHMYVQVTSGVSLIEAMASVANGNYGHVSAEFKSMIKLINTGIPMEKALEDSTIRNPSLYYRRMMWQISNGLKSGSDMGSTIRNIIDYIAAEQKILIRKYGSQLSPLTVGYMMVAIILPSLGVTFLMVLSSFAKIPITENTFWFIIGFVALFQFMFLGILKSKRPNLI